MATKLDKVTLRNLARILKEQKIGKPIDARKEINPHTIRGGKTLKEWAQKFEPVLDAKATIVPTKSVKEKGYKKIYERTSAIDPKSKKKTEFLLVPHSADEQVRIEKGRIVISHPAGIESTQIPVEYHNLEQWMRETTDLDFKGKNYAFRFYGGSSRVFPNWLSMMDELEHYKSIQEALDGSPYQQREMYRNIEIVKVHSKAVWEKQKRENKAKRRKKK